MDSLQFLNLRKSLKENQELVLQYDNTVMIRELKETGGYKKRIIGKLEDWEESIIPTKNKLWATPPIPGKQKYFKFGEPLPKRDNNDLEVKILIGIILTFKNEAKKSIWTDTAMKFTYDVIEWNDIKVYFYAGLPKFIENKGNRIYISQSLPELKLEVFENLESVK